MSVMSNGVYRPPRARAVFEGATTQYMTNNVAVQKVQLLAGLAVGTAVISFPAHYAANAEPEMGRGVRLYLGNRVFFRGVVGDGPFQVRPNADEVELILYDDKWLVARTTIGMRGVGTKPVSAPGFWGFNDVGFEVVFNRDGKPNKDPDHLDFITNSTAVFWTLKDVMEFIFLYYVDPSDARLVDAAILTHGYLRYAANLNLVGRNALQAIDVVAQLAGESWGLQPLEAYSMFSRVLPGAGTARQVFFFEPKKHGRANQATTYHVSSGSSSKSIRDACDIYQVQSGLILKEHTYTNTADYPLLVKVATFTDAEYAVQFGVDVTMYAAHNLGPALSEGSKPKKWEKDLVTRFNAARNAYLGPAAIAANPALMWNERIAKPLVWVSLDGTEAGARLCTGGMRLNCENGTIDLKSKIKLLPSVGEPESVTVASWASVGIWLTVATYTGLPVTVASGSATYLPKSKTNLIRRTDLTPEQRGIVWLPKLGGSNNEIHKVSLVTETYVDVEPQLEDLIDGAIGQTPAVESPVELEFPFMPELYVGDRLIVRGRELGLSDSEVITDISYDIHDAFTVRVRASNALAGVNPEQFAEPV